MLKFSSDDIIPYTDGLHPPDDIFPFPSYHESKGKTLCFIAARHQRGAGSETHCLIDDTFATFKPQAIVIEGLNALRDPAWSEEIKKHYLEAAQHILKEQPWDLPENLHALLKAKTEKTHIFSGEPSDEAQIGNLLEEGYKEEDYLLYDFLLSIDGWVERGISGDMLPALWERHVHRFASFMHIPGLKDFSFFEELFRKRTNDIFALEKMKFTAPEARAESGTLGHMASTLSRYRDQNILMTIELAFKGFDRVLVVYGGSHFFTLKTALEMQMGKGRIAF